MFVPPVRCLKMESEEAQAVSDVNEKMIFYSNLSNAPFPPQQAFVFL